MLSDEAVAARTSVALRRPVTYDEALDLAAQGQPAAKTVVDQAARALGRLIAAVANLTTCHRIIITGEGARLAEAAGEAMQQQIAADRDPAAAPLHLQTPHLTADDWAQGPAVLAIQTLVRPSASNIRPPGQGIWGPTVDTDIGALPIALPAPQCASRRRAWSSHLS